MDPEYIHLGHDNTVDLLLKADNQDGAGAVAVDLTDVIKITLSFGAVLIESTDKAAGLITWDQTGYAVGEIRIAVGGESLPVGSMVVPLIVYDASTLNGVVWDRELPFIVVASKEASP